jgi:hypothetical protein
MRATFGIGGRGQDRCRRKTHTAPTSVPLVAPIRDSPCAVCEESRLEKMRVSANSTAAVWSAVRWAHGMRNPPKRSSAASEPHSTP